MGVPVSGLGLLVSTASASEPEDDEDDREVFDFSHPEDVLILIDYRDIKTYERFSWNDWEVVETHIMTHPRWDGKEVTGAASYEYGYGGFLNYTIEGMIEPPGEWGFYVVEDVTGVYTRGDGWTTDDDMDFYHGEVRPATNEEVAAFYGVSFWDTED
jgi:hypothetical protein